MTTHSDKSRRFEELFWPHLPAAYNVARWLTKRDADADDVVQEAMLRAFRFFDSYRGENARAWVLTIVRNACYSWLKENRLNESPSDPDELLQEVPEQAPGPEDTAMKNAKKEQVQRCLGALPLEFREILILRELEGLSYKEITTVTGLPMGTVMSRLARGRDRLQHALLTQMRGEAHHEL